MSAPYVIAASMLGCAFGWLLVPWASDVLLHRVRDRADAWWAESLEAYRAFKRDHPEDEPSSSASGTEGAVGIWRDEAFAAGLAGSLTEERLQALAAAGFKVGDLEAAGTADERCRRYSFEPRPRSRMLCAAALGAAFAVAAAIVPSVPAAAMLGICASAMAVSVVCDLRARVIPLEAHSCTSAGLRWALARLRPRGRGGRLGNRALRGSGLGAGEPPAGSALSRRGGGQGRRALHGGAVLGDGRRRPVRVRGLLYARGPRSLGRVCGGEAEAGRRHAHGAVPLGMACLRRGGWCGMGVSARL